MCSCCNKQTSHLVIVWLTLIYYVVTLILAVLELAGRPDIPPGWYYASAAFCVIGILICSLDIYGIQEKNIWYKVPFLVWVILTTIIMGVLAVAYVTFYVRLERNTRQSVWRKYYKPTFNIYGAVIGISVPFFILFGCFSYVISSHIKEVKAQEVLPVRQEDVKMQARRESWVKY